MASVSRRVESLGIQTNNNLCMPSVVPSREQSGTIISYREQQAITYLRSHAGSYVPSGELADFIWGDGSNPRLASRLIQLVRAKMGTNYVESSPFGYRLTNSRAANVAMVCSRCGAAVVSYEGEFVCYGCPSTQHADLEVGRAEGPGERSGSAWTDEESEFAVAHAGDMTFEEIGDLLQRSESAVRGRYAQLGLAKPYVASQRRKR